MFAECHHAVQFKLFHYSINVAGIEINASAFLVGLTRMLLAGIAITAISGALVGLLSYLADDSMLRTLPAKVGNAFFMAMADGMSNREIAEALQISEHTVKVHLWRLFRRLNVKSRSQASHLARTAGLLDS